MPKTVLTRMVVGRSRICLAWVMQSIPIAVHLVRHVSPTACVSWKTTLHSRRDHARKGIGLNRPVFIRVLGVGIHLRSRDLVHITSSIGDLPDRATCSRFNSSRRRSHGPEYRVSMRWRFLVLLRRKQQRDQLLCYDFE